MAYIPYNDHKPLARAKFLVLPYKVFRFFFKLWDALLGQHITRLTHALVDHHQKDKL